MTEKLRCEYPKCKKEGTHSQALKLANEDDASVELPFCDYHFYIVMGGHFEAKIHKMQTAEIDSKLKTTFELLGPFKEVEIAEQVMGAREMVLKLKSDDKDLNKKG